MPDTYAILGKLGVPECARSELTARVVAGVHDRPDPIMVSNSGIISKQFDYLPVMDMSFRRDGVDYVDRVNVDVYEPFMATAYRYRCDGYYGAVAYMPKCQNLAVLELPDRDVQPGIAPYLAGIPGITNFNNYWGGGGTRSGDDPTTPTAQVPEPGTLAILIIGLLALLISRKGRA